MDRPIDFQQAYSNIGKVIPVALIGKRGLTNSDDRYIYVYSEYSSDKSGLSELARFPDARIVVFKISIFGAMVERLV